MWEKRASTRVAKAASSRAEKGRGEEEEEERRSSRRVNSWLFSGGEG